MPEGRLNPLRRGTQSRGYLESKRRHRICPGLQRPLYRVSDRGGPATPVTALDASRQENFHRFPLFLPDGQHLLYVAWSPNPEHTGIYLGSLDSNESRKLADAYSSVAYYSGHLLYVPWQDFDGLAVRCLTARALGTAVSRHRTSGFFSRRLAKRTFPSRKATGPPTDVSSCMKQAARRRTPISGPYLSTEIGPRFRSCSQATPMRMDASLLTASGSRIHPMSREDGKYTSDRLCGPAEASSSRPVGGGDPSGGGKTERSSSISRPNGASCRSRCNPARRRFRASVPRVVVDEPVDRSFSVSADGQRFLIPTALPEASAPIRVVVNWMLETK